MSIKLNTAITTAVRAEADKIIAKSTTTFQAFGEAYADSDAKSAISDLAFKLAFREALYPRLAETRKPDGAFDKETAIYKEARASFISGVLPGYTKLEGETVLDGEKITAKMCMVPAEQYKMMPKDPIADIKAGKALKHPRGNLIRDKRDRINTNCDVAWHRFVKDAASAADAADEADEADEGTVAAKEEVSQDMAVAKAVKPLAAEKHAARRKKAGVTMQDLDAGALILAHGAAKAIEESKYLRDVFDAYIASQNKKAKKAA